MESSKQNTSTPGNQLLEDQNDTNNFKRGGWITFPFIIGNIFYISNTSFKLAYYYYFYFYFYFFVIAKYIYIFQELIFRVDKQEIWRVFQWHPVAGLLTGLYS